MFDGGDEAARAGVGGLGARAGRAKRAEDQGRPQSQGRTTTQAAHPPPQLAAAGSTQSLSKCLTATLGRAGQPHASARARSRAGQAAGWVPSLTTGRFHRAGVRLRRTAGRKWLIGP